MRLPHLQRLSFILLQPFIEFSKFYLIKHHNLSIFRAGDKIDRHFVTIPVNNGFSVYFVTILYFA